MSIDAPALVCWRRSTTCSDEDFTPAEQQSWVKGLVTVLIDNGTIRVQASANTTKQFIESPDLSDAVTDAAMSNQTSHNKMADHFFTDDQGPAGEAARGAGAGEPPGTSSLMGRPRT